MVSPGFKNGTDGSVGVAGVLMANLNRPRLTYRSTIHFTVDAMRSSSNPHAFMGVTTQGLAAIVKTRGNPDLHVILRGGTNGTNYHSEAIQDVKRALLKARPKDHPSIMVDCSRTLFHILSYTPLMAFATTSHSLDGNSQKNHNNQPKVIDAICEQLCEGERAITGVMIESNIHAGRQDVPPEGPSALKYGISITDACIDWETTIPVLEKLNKVRLLSSSHCVPPFNQSFRLRWIGGMSQR